VLGRSGEGGVLLHKIIDPRAFKSRQECFSTDEARRIAVNFARLPELLKSQPHWR